MKIAIISDIHDNIWKLEELLPRLEGLEAIVFCGDFCAPFTLKMLAEGFKGVIHVAFGNNDGDKLLLSRVAAEAGNVSLYGEFAEIEFDGRKVAVTHYPPIARSLAASGRYDLVCCGHSHEHIVEEVGNTLLVNPGEVMGRFGRPTYAIFDTEARKASLQEI
jgi:hypothetical protein